MPCVLPPPPTERELEAVATRLAERRLHTFVREAWKCVEPETPFRDGWHLRLICEHLEAVERGDIKNLLINVPPGCCKSLICSVFFPAWVWIRQPSARFLCASYAQELATRDALKARAILQSSWYRHRWGEKFAILADENQKRRYGNSRRGFRMSTSVGGPGTGEHPDFIIVDDPHNVRQSESPAERQAALDWWDGTISTRGRSRGVRRVVIMQRLHHRDLAGHLLASGAEWEHLCLPMRWEPDRMHPTSIGGVDPRTEIGELLWPELFGVDAVESLTAELGQSRASGQLQQRPPEHYEGAEWPREYFTDSIWFDEWPNGKDLQLKVVALDPSKGATEKADYSAIVTLALHRDGSLWVDADIERRDTVAIAQACVRHNSEFTPDAFGIETNGFQSLLCAPIQEACRKKGLTLPLWEINNSENKRERIRRLTPYLHRGELRFKRGSRGAALLVEMLREFPGHLHDDGPDALEMAVRLSRILWGGGNAGSGVERVGT